MSRFDSTRFSAVGPIFKVTSNRAKRILEAETFLVLLTDSDHGEFELHIEDESSAESSSRIYYDLKEIEPEAWNALRSLDEISVFDSRSRQVLAQKLVSCLSASKIVVSPFRLENRGLGFAVWGWTEDFIVPEEFLTRAGLVAEQIALSLSASLSEQKSNEQGEKLAALLELSTSIFSSLNYKEVLQKAVNLSMEIVGATGGTIFLLDKEENLLVPLVTIDEAHEEAINAVRLKPGQGLTGYVAQVGMGMISNHSQNDPRLVQVPGTPLEKESLISVPLTWSGHVIGVITLRNNRGKEFGQEDLEILTIFARQAADAIENARLYEHLQTAYEELSATQDRLIMAEKLKALGDMAGGVAHDFNNILGTILGRTQLLRMKNKQPELAAELQTIENAALEGRTAVRRLQDFTHVSSATRHSKTDLNDVVRGAVEFTSPAWKTTAQKEAVKIDLHLDLQNVPGIVGNGDELKEAVSNVILNAVDALHQGGNIWVSTEVSAGKIFLRIADDGIGMNETTKNKMFFPFFSTKGKKGSGMGLAIVYGIMFRHQVDISVESSPGRGAEFIFKFNIPDEALLRSVPPPAVPRSSNLKVLVVDDDPELLDVVEEMVGLLGHVCSKADGGRCALNILQEEKFDLVITDLGMPEVGGWEVAQFCRSRYPETPIILISGWGAQLDGEEASKRVDAVLPKPFRIDEFRETIDRVTSKAAVSRSTARPILS